MTAVVDSSGNELYGFKLPRRRKTPAFMTRNDLWDMECIPRGS